MNDDIINFLYLGEYESASKIIAELLNTNTTEICTCISIKEPNTVSKYNIPQYSCYPNGTYEMLRYLRMSGDYGPSFVEIGEHFLESGHKQTAYLKYGENHAKLAELLGIVEIKKIERKRVFMSDIGKIIEKLDVKKQNDCFIKLAARIPIIQEAIKLGITNQKDLEEHLSRYLSQTTATRRRKNTWMLIEKLQGCE